MHLKLPPRVTLASNVDILRWQVRWRALAAGVVVAVLALLQLRGWAGGEPLDLAAVLGAYLGVTVGAALLAPRGASGASLASLAVHVTILVDVAALISVTAIVAPEGRHDWVLVVGFFVVHLAEYSFGRGASLIATGASIAGYLLLSVGRPGATAPEWAMALLTAAAFVAVASTFLSQYASRRRRLRRIIALFGRAEEGDFAEAYDVAADRRPDAITAVGGAYNRVRARLESLVLTDALTGCLNRRGFEHALDRELARAGRAESEVAMLALDIDNFKDVNDNFGHVAGDETLEQLGKLLLSSVRTGDIVARVGGDEFVILCPDTGIEGAEQLGASLCQFVDQHAFDGHGAPVRMTVSAGAAAIEGGAADHTASELKLRADRALYDAKHAGRNRVRRWELATA